MKQQNGPRSYPCSHRLGQKGAAVVSLAFCHNIPLDDLESRFGKNFQGVSYILFLWTGLPIFVGFIEGVRWLFMPVDDFYFSYCDG